MDTLTANVVDTLAGLGAQQRAPLVAPMQYRILPGSTTGGFADNCTGVFADNCIRTDAVGG